MSKGHLEAKLEDISKLLYEVYDVPSGICEYINNILFELKSIKESNPSEALEKFDYIENDINFAYDDDYISYDYTDDIIYIKGALIKAQEQEKEIDRLENQCLDFLADNIRLKKILDIIKEKNVDVILLKRCKTVEEYNYCINFSKDDEVVSFEAPLTQEEFDLLKRIY